MAKVSYRDLRVWQESMDLTVVIYDLTERFPRRELFGLTQQMKKAAVSIPSNIAEGYGRRTHRQTYSFLENALGSAFELETQLEISRRLRFTPANAYEEINSAIKKIGRGLSALMAHVERDARVFKRPRP
jgi:four helix bundle protein